MEVMNKSDKSKFLCYCGKSVSRREDFDGHLVIHHGVKLQDSATVRTYAENDVKDYPKICRTATQDDIDRVLHRRRKKYEAELARRASTAAPGRQAGGELAFQLSESDGDSVAVKASPPVKRARGGRCRVLQTSPPENAAGDAAMQPMIWLERSSELENAVKSTSRYGLRPRVPAPEVPADLFAGLKEARKRKKAGGINREAAAAKSDSESEDDVFLPDTEERAPSTDAVGWASVVANATLDQEEVDLLADLVAPDTSVKSATVKLVKVKEEVVREQVDYGEVLDLTWRGGPGPNAPSAGETEDAPSDEQNPIRMSILGDRRPKNQWTGPQNFTVIVRDTERLITRIPSPNSVPTNPAGPMEGTDDSPNGRNNVSSESREFLDLTGDKVASHSGNTGAASEEMMPEETLAAADTRESVGSASVGKSAKLKSVVVVPLLSLNLSAGLFSERLRRSGTEYISPLRGLNERCKIPVVHPG